jgi:hypothetical protein
VRTKRSFAVFFALFAAAIGGWIAARHASLVDGIPTPFRKMLEWNGTLWGGLFNPSRLNKYPKPPSGKIPRFNGDLGLKTPIDVDSWRMKVTSDRAGPDGSLQLGITALRALPKTDTSALFFCIEGWSDPLSYAGVRFSDFLKYYGLGTRTGKPWNPNDPGSASELYRYVGLVTPDGEYYVSIDMESMLHPQTMLAYEENDKPLDTDNGAPLRLIIPVKYGIKSLKRIGTITFSDVRPPDYWAERGYDWFAGL